MTDNECVEIEIELGDETIEVIHKHMRLSGLEFSDALGEMLEMSIDAIDARAKKTQE